MDLAWHLTQFKTERVSDRIQSIFCKQVRTITHSNFGFYEKHSCCYWIDQNREVINELQIEQFRRKLCQLKIEQKRACLRCVPHTHGLYYTAMCSLLLFIWNLKTMTATYLWIRSMFTKPLHQQKLKIYLFLEKLSWGWIILTFG